MLLLTHDWLLFCVRFKNVPYLRPTSILVSTSMEKMSYKLTLRIMISILLLSLVALQVDFPVLFETAMDSNLWLFPVAIACVIGQIFFLSLRWHRYLNVGRQRVGFGISLLTNIIGYFANVIFITSIGGIIAKSALAVRYGLSVAQAIFATALDRFMTMAALVVFSLVSLPFLIETLDSKLLGVLFLSVVSVVAAVLAFILALRSGNLNDFIFSCTKRSRLLVMLRSYTENRELMSVSVHYSFVAQICFFASVYVLFLGLEHQGIDHLQLLALLPILALVSSLPISFGGWGIREGAFVYGLGLIGFTPETALLLSIQVGIVGLIAPMIVGGVCLFYDRLKVLNMIRIAKP